MEPEVVQPPETLSHPRTGGATRANTPPRGRRGPKSPVFQSGTFQRLGDDHPKAKDFTHVCSEGACGDRGGRFFKLTKDKRSNWCTSKAVNHLKSEHPMTTGAVYVESEAKNHVRCTSKNRSNLKPWSLIFTRTSNRTSNQDTRSPDLFAATTSSLSGISSTNEPEVPSSNGKARSLVIVIFTPKFVSQVVLPLSRSLSRVRKGQQRRKLPRRLRLPRKKLPSLRWRACLNKAV